VVTTVAGTGSFGHRVGPLGKGTLQYPMDLSIDSEGRVLIADGGTGYILLCGTGQPGLEPGQLRKPAAVLIHSGYLWIADLGNHRILTARWPSTLDLNTH
jgi:hypothetical protein